MTPPQPAPSPVRRVRRADALRWAPRPGLVGALGLLLLYGALQFAVSLMIALVLLGIAAGQMSAPDLGAYQAAAVTVIAAVIMLVITHRQWPERWRLDRAWEGLGLTRPQARRYYAIGAAAGLAIALLGDKLTAALAHGRPVPQSIDHLGLHASVAARLILVWPAVTLVPLVEEVLFRGVLLCAVLAWHPVGSRETDDAPSRLWTTLAVVACAAVFGLAHLPELSWQWYGLPSLTLSGAVLGWLRIRSGSLWPAVIAHATTNAMAALAVLGAIAPMR